MTLSQLYTGALLFKTDVFTALRERSDVFLRGFLVLLVAALIAGAFASLTGVAGDLGPRMSKEQVQQIALDGFNRSYNGPPDQRAVIEPYVTEIASMVFDLTALPPRAGQDVRPVVALVNWLGRTLATPFGFGFVGWTLLMGLLVQLTSHWLGGRGSIAEMLGLTALAAAPQAFNAIPNLLTFLSEITNIGALTLPNGLLGLLIGVWSLLIYVRATSVAQQISTGRAVGAIAVAAAILFVALAALLFIAIGLFTGLIASLVAQSR